MSLEDVIAFIQTVLSDEMECEIMLANNSFSLCFSNGIIRHITVD